MSIWICMSEECEYYNRGSVTRCDEPLGNIFECRKARLGKNDNRTHLVDDNICICGRPKNPEFEVCYSCYREEKNR